MDPETLPQTGGNGDNVNDKKQVNADEIVGAVAYEITKAKFMALVQDNETSGALIILSDFTPRQLAGFSSAGIKDGDHNGKVKIRYPRSELGGYGIPEEYLVDISATSIRNSVCKTENFGKIIITTDSEGDTKGSLGEKEKTNADQLKNGDVAVEPWIKIISGMLGVSFTDETQKQIGALMKGLFDCGRFTINNLANYLYEVIKTHDDGIPLTRAAGMRLPTLGLPLYEDCFVSLTGAKSGQPSQWGKKFEDHQKSESYLNKRGPSGDLLDPATLQKRLEDLQEEDNGSTLPDDVLKAFEEYIKEETVGGPATRKLLFEKDWSVVRECFDTKQKTTAKKFAEETEKALKYDGRELSEDDKSILEILKKTVRKSGSADEETKKFFVSHVDAIAGYTPNKSLILEWEDFVYGRRIVCRDILQGLLECLQRINRITTPGKKRSIVIEGVKQSKPADFENLNPKACKYFERNYGKIEVQTKKLIRFEKTGKGKSLLPVYSEDVAPKLSKKGIGKKGGKGFEFRITISEGDSHLTTIPLIWNFPADSVLAQESGDLDAILSYAEKSGSPLALGLATYENVGNKGVPPPVCLQSVDGFGSSPGARGRGSFIPKSSAIVSLYTRFGEAIEDASHKGWIEEDMANELWGKWKEFNDLYREALKQLRQDALNHSGTWAMVGAFNRLLESVQKVENQTTRKKLIKEILLVGTVTVAESNHRPALAVVCPWNPQRMEGEAARKQQILGAIGDLLTTEDGSFSDGRTGSLFFRDMLELAQAPLQPEIAAVWNENELKPMMLSQALGGYSLHESPENRTQASALENSAAESSATLMREIEEYLRLQPHERDSLSILLYNCDSPDLPSRLVEDLNKRNKESKDSKITCQVMLTHNDEQHLHELYKKLVAGADEQIGQAEETGGSFLSKIRINITAANRLFKEEGSRSQPADIAYCRDLLSHRAKAEWEWVPRNVIEAAKLRAHQWNRIRPFVSGDSTTKMLLCCPAQTETGWNVLHAISYCCHNGADDAWEAGKCAVIIRTLNFDNKEVSRIIEETHKLAVWVVNQDELLDRRILEDKGVKVIRYIQSTTHGRNLVISSKAREVLLRNTILERLKLMLPSETTDETFKKMVDRIITEANSVSGGLVLKAARRSNNTSELFGIVLSKYIVQSEIGLKQPAAWCFLDDFSHWLGKEEGTNIADLLALAPTYRNGKPHLNIVVTEAKFIRPDQLSTEKTKSEKQLSDTLVQISQALNEGSQPLDQNLWLSRISDMLMSRTTGAAGEKAFDLENWRKWIRERQCTFSVWGYSHVFVHMTADGQVCDCKGIKPKDKATVVRGFQEIFDWGKTRNLLLQMYEGKAEETRTLRQQNGLVEMDYAVIELKEPKKTTPEKPKAKEEQTKAEGKSAAENAATAEEAGKEKLDEDEGGTNVNSEPKPDPEGGGPNAAPAAGAGKEEENAPAAQSPAVLTYLGERAKLTKGASEEDQKWLKETAQKLKTALVQKGLSAVTPEGFEPILTPNAAIIKFKGGANMTVPAAEKYADEFYTSEGIRIINVRPEPMRVAFSVARTERQILRTTKVLLNLFQGGKSNPTDEKVFVGVREEDGDPQFLNPFAQPHTLVAGATGSGKSILIKNILLHIALSKTPEQTHIYLIDAKRGVDYISLKFLPHVELGSGKIIDKIKESLETFEGLVEEMEKRYDLFLEENVDNIQAYRKKTGKALPTIWVVHDEFADWMKLKEYCDGVTDYVDRLSIKARGAGIFLIFAAQRPDNTVMPMQLRSQLGNRLVLKVADPGTAEIATGEKQSRAEKLLPKGHMLAKTDEEFVYIQVPFIESEEVATLVQLIRLYHAYPPSNALPSYDLPGQ
jgi:S-DNA-T family DNA segregation ATPase FtsK/SpoIIIE